MDGKGTNEKCPLLTGTLFFIQGLNPVIFYLLLNLIVLMIFPVEVINLTR